MTEEHDSGNTRYHEVLAAYIFILNARIENRAKLADGLVKLYSIFDQCRMWLRLCADWSWLDSIQRWHFDEWEAVKERYFYASSGRGDEAARMRDEMKKVHSKFLYSDVSFEVLEMIKAEVTDNENQPAILFPAASRAKEQWKSDRASFRQKIIESGFYE